MPEEFRVVGSAPLERTNALGLHSEQMDGDTGEMVGNFPQEFSHMTLINTAVQKSEVTASIGLESSLCSGIGGRDLKFSLTEGMLDNILAVVGWDRRA